MLESSMVVATIPVTDLDRSKKFYGDTLGLRFLWEKGPLKTTGHIAQPGPARGAWFHDPDGNTLGLRQG